jgi:hypothetical protein
MTSAKKSEALVEEQNAWNPEAPVVLDPDDMSLKSYTDQHKNKTPVCCRNCAVWNRPIAVYDNKPMCSTEHDMVVQIGGVKTTRRMQEDTWSCRLYFVPLESATLLDCLPKTKEQVWAVSHGERFLKSAVKFRLKLDDKTSGTIPSLVETDAFQYSLLLAQQHHTAEAFNYTFPLLRQLAVDIKNKMKEDRRKPRKKRNVKFRPGDLIEWTTSEGRLMSGWFQCIGRRDGSVTLILTPETVASSGSDSAVIKYALRDWREKGNPTLKTKAVVTEASC